MFDINKKNVTSMNKEEMVAYLTTPQRLRSINSLQLETTQERLMSVSSQHQHSTREARLQTRQNQ